MGHNKHKWLFNKGVAIDSHTIKKAWDFMKGWFRGAPELLTGRYRSEPLSDTIIITYDPDYGLYEIHGQDQNYLASADSDGLKALLKTRRYERIDNG